MLRLVFAYGTDWARRKVRSKTASLPPGMNVCRHQAQRKTATSSSCLLSSSNSICINIGLTLPVPPIQYIYGSGMLPFPQEGFPNYAAMLSWPGVPCMIFGLMSGSSARARRCYGVSAGETSIRLRRPEGRLLLVSDGS